MVRRSPTTSSPASNPCRKRPRPRSVPARLADVHATAAAGLGFLLSVLWFDLMFDVQARGLTGDLPSDVRNSIAAYYRRVTTAARPMNRLIALAMLVTLAAIVGELVTDAVPAGVAWATLAL